LGKILISKDVSGKWLGEKSRRLGKFFEITAYSAPLTDGIPSVVIDQDWINLFIQDSLNKNKLKVVQNIERVPFVYLKEALQAKLEGGRIIAKKSCHHSKPFY